MEREKIEPEKNTQVDMCPAPAIQQEPLLEEETLREEEPLREVEPLREEGPTLEQLKDLIARLQNGKRGRPTQELKCLKEKLKALEEGERPHKRTKR